MARNFDPATLGELVETVVETRRVSKTVKGGRIMRFAAVVVVGDQNVTLATVSVSLPKYPKQLEKQLKMLRRI